MAASINRPLRGSRQHDFYPSVHSPSLRSLDSAFQLQEYITLLIRDDPHNISRIVSLPKAARGCSSSDDDRDDSVDESCWIYEHLRSPSRLAQDLNHPLITTLQQECTRDTCPEMKAGEWLYLCVAHGSGGNSMEQCCAIDYILHTVDSATALLNSPRVFPSRISIPQSSHRHFSSLARRLGRIFAHAYFQHREAFEQAEAESSLYSRYLALTSMFELVPPDYLNIPARDGNPPTLQSASIEIGLPPTEPNAQSSPNMGGRPRTDTMVFAENFAMRPEDDPDAYHAQTSTEHNASQEHIYDRGDPPPAHRSIYLPHGEEQVLEHDLQEDSAEPDKEEYDESLTVPLPTEPDDHPVNQEEKHEEQSMEQQPETSELYEKPDVTGETSDIDSHATTSEDIVLEAVDLHVAPTSKLEEPVTLPEPSEVEVNAEEPPTSDAAAHSVENAEDVEAETKVEGEAPVSSGQEDGEINTSDA